jgi:CRP/FNR family transcriptional activator FtrB
MAAATPGRSADEPQAPALAALRAVPWLAAVGAGTLTRLADAAILHRAPQGLQLFEQAERPTFAQLLIDGVVELVATRGADETLIEVVRAPDLLLPAAALNRQPYLVGARVQREARVLLLPVEAFRAALASDHAFALAVLACQAAQFRRQMRQAKSVRLRTAVERVGCYARSLAAEALAEEVRLPNEKRLIASQLGMSRETLSRALPGLAKFGLRIVGDVLRVDDRAAAMAAFPFDPLIDGAEPIDPLSPTRTDA